MYYVTFAMGFTMQGWDRSPSKAECFEQVKNGIETGEITEGDFNIIISRLIIAREED